MKKIFLMFLCTMMVSSCLVGSYNFFGAKRYAKNNFTFKYGPTQRDFNKNNVIHGFYHPVDSGKTQMCYLFFKEGTVFCGRNFYSDKQRLLYAICRSKLGQDWSISSGITGIYKLRDDTIITEYIYNFYMDYYFLREKFKVIDKDNMMLLTEEYVSNKGERDIDTINARFAYMNINVFPSPDYTIDKRFKWMWESRRERKEWQKRKKAVKRNINKDRNKYQEKSFMLKYGPTLRNDNRNNKILGFYHPADTARSKICVILFKDGTIAKCENDSNGLNKAMSRSDKGKNWDIASGIYKVNGDSIKAEYISFDDYYEEYFFPIETYKIINRDSIILVNNKYVPHYKYASYSEKDFIDTLNILYTFMKTDKLPSPDYTHDKKYKWVWETEKERKAWIERKKTAKRVR